MSKSEHLSINIGKCPDYHGHIVSGSGTLRASVGWAATISDGELYIEPHGQVVVHSRLPHIGKRTVQELKEDAGEKLGKFPQEKRRSPSNKAIRLGAI